MAARFYRTRSKFRVRTKNQAASKVTRAVSFLQLFRPETPFRRHFGSLLAQFWHQFQPRSPPERHFGSISSPGGPLGGFRGALGRIWVTSAATLGDLWGDFGAIFGRPRASGSIFWVILGTFLALFRPTSRTKATRTTVSRFRDTFSRNSTFVWEIPMLSYKATLDVMQ